MTTMDTIVLTDSTGDMQIDALLQGIIGLYETAFPTMIQACYVIGSYADGTAIPASDLDMCVVFARPLTTPQLDQAWALARHAAQISPIRLDSVLTLVGALTRAEAVLLKLGSRLVYGTDMRSDIVLPSRAQYQQDTTWSPYRFLGQIVRDQQVLSYPLCYPDPSDPFYGYTEKRIPVWYPPDVSHGTKEILTGILRTATALVALQSEHYVASKHMSVATYRTTIGGEWSEYLETFYRKGKEDWHYLRPAASSDQTLLRELCARTLAFENHYFQHYRDYLLHMLHGNPEEQLFAAQRLLQVRYPDAEMIDALQHTCDSDNQAVQSAAQEALTQLQEQT